MIRFGYLLALCCCAALATGCDSRDISQPTNETPRVGHTGDVLTESIGIEILGGIFRPIIKEGSQIPVTIKEEYTTVEDNQVAVDVHVLAGNAEMAKDNRTIGKFTLYGISPAPRGVPRIEVAYIVDSDGVLTTKAKDLGTGKENEIQVLGVPTQAEE